MENKYTISFNLTSEKKDMLDEIVEEYKKYYFGKHYRTTTLKHFIEIMYELIVNLDIPPDKIELLPKEKNELKLIIKVLNEKCNILSAKLEELDLKWKYYESRLEKEKDKNIIKARFNCM